VQRLLRSRSLTALANVAVAVGVVVAVAQVDVDGTPDAFAAAAVALTLAAAGYLVWTVEPVYIFCAAIFLSPVSGNWDEMGIPAALAPDRLLLVAGIGAVLIRTPGSAQRPRLLVSPVHWLLLATAVYAFISALLADTLRDRGSFLDLVEAFGFVPFLVFVCAPLVFRTERDRDLLLATFVALGAYLGATTLLQTLGLNDLVFPRYILDPAVGIHFDLPRGPFVDAVSNGYAQYVCAVAAAIAWTRWRHRRGLALAAAASGLLCLAGVFMCLERSVWLGAGVATLVALFAIPNARRHAPAVLVLVALAVGASYVLIPGFADRVSNRAEQEDTIWDRKNQNRAAANMIAERPLLGFGWGRFLDNSPDYYEQADDYPLTRSFNFHLHSTVLTYAVELGLIGLLLWGAAIVSAVGGALATRGPPDLRAWRIGLLAVAICFLIVTNFVPISVFPNLSVWLWAGVVWSGRYAMEAAPTPGRPGSATGR
jgi:O-antigen ligase